LCQPVIFVIFCWQTGQIPCCCSQRCNSFRLPCRLWAILTPGAPDLLRLGASIDEECGHAQASDEMQKRVAYLEIQLSDYRAVVDLDDRARIVQQFLAVGQLLNYRAIDTHHIGEGIEHWKDYASWTYETMLAEVIIAGRAIVDEEIAARDRVKEKCGMRQVERELVDTRRELAKYQPPPRTFLECTLRRWCALEKLPFQGKTLAGEELDAFLQESSERRLLAFIDSGESAISSGSITNNVLRSSNSISARWSRIEEILL
jgi:hypothetical protein